MKIKWKCLLGGFALLFTTYFIGYGLVWWFGDIGKVGIELVALRFVSGLTPVVFVGLSYAICAELSDE